ncbi:hypothetical protein L1049_026628 [Liquidambar formosana]|uniref:BZIP domain-containing protein n=1 Tax=Liquidambar formosana TaxID=63359 RepID=A0AAP0NHC8_LIQFO
MGAGEESTPAKSSKPTASTQETPINPSYPDWATSMQAYYGMGATPPPFFTSPAASPTPHPYLWGPQHPMIPPYGTPLPYPAVYPHGGFYAHPNMAQGVALTNTETGGKAPDGKDPTSMKKSKGTSGNTGVTVGKSGESGKAASGSGTEGASESAESGSEGSSDASDENANQQASSASKKKSFNQMLADANAKSNNAAQYNGGNLSASVPGNPVVPVPTSNLNMGMDLWNGSPSGVSPMKTRPNASHVAPATMVGREGTLHDHQWVQDERELKRQRRKQSNRESARRSRLRKQAECGELQTKVEKLSNENLTLRDELHRLTEECEKLTSENNNIMEELTQLYGPDAISNLQVNNHSLALHNVNGEDSSHGQDCFNGK